MSRPFQPLAIAKAKGADKKNPQRYRDRKNEPKSSGPVGECPNILFKEEWNEIAAIVPDGVLTEADRLWLELSARLLADIRTSESPKLSAFRELGSFLSKMGLNPSDRHKVCPAPGDTEEDPWDEFLGAN